MKSAIINRSINTKGPSVFRLESKIIGFNIYESLSKPYLTGELRILDTQNMASRLPILGGEKIIMTVEDCYGKEREFVFYATKVVSRKQSSLSSLTYQIHFASRFYIESSMKKISKSYITKLGEEIIADLLSETNFDLSRYNFFDSNKPFCCIIPNWRALESIKWVSSRTITDDQRFDSSPTVTFSDINQDIYTVPLDFLYDESTNTTRGKLYYKWQRPSNKDAALIYNKRTPEHLYTFERGPDIIKTSDVIENSVYGMYSNDTQEIDVFARDTQTHIYRYSSDFENSQHLGDKRFDADTFDAPDIAHWRTIISSDALFSQENHMNKIESVLHKHVSKFQQTENLVIRGVLPWSGDLRVGQKYDIEMPSFSNTTKADRGLQEIDKTLSGTFIISSIKHEFSAANNNAVAVVEMFRDALTES